MFFFYIFVDLFQCGNHCTGPQLVIRSRAVADGSPVESGSPLLPHTCPVCQYRLWSFQMGGTKLERFLPKNQHTQRTLLNFENWVNGEVSKIGQDFRK